MGTKRMRFASSSVVFGLLFCAAVSAQGNLPIAPDVIVPEGKAPVLDGTIKAGEWADGFEYVVRRAAREFGKGRIKRVRRELYVSLESPVSPYALIVKLAFIDPATNRRVIVDITPLNPPKPPILVTGVTSTGKIENKSAETADIKFRFLNPGFVMEARLPLDLIEVARPPKAYEFSVQFWSMFEQKSLAAFPVTAQGALIQPVLSKFMPAKNWGIVVPREDSPTSEAIRLLEMLWMEMGPAGRRRDPRVRPLISPYIGARDGRRSDEPLAKLEARLKRLEKRHPDYAALPAHRIRVHIGRNDLEGALSALRKMAAVAPGLDRSPFKLRFELRLLRDLGRFEVGLALIKKHLANLGGAGAFAAELQAEFQQIERDWQHELAYRKEDAARDDLPRVRLKTSRGDILLELFEDDVPNAVANFVELVEKKFYDGTKFHWSTASTYTDGGDPDSRNEKPHDDGFGGPGYLIESEVGRRLHFPFTVSFIDKRRARRAQGSIFRIMVAPAPTLDGIHTVFGRILEGQDVARRLEYYDVLESATVVRKRDHEYKAVRRN